MNFQALSTVELRQICYFLTIVDSGYNFSRAAERLQIEQPPLSQRIRALEKRMRLELFDRKCRPVQLTAAGKVFEQEVRLALIQIETAIAQAQKTHRGEVGHLSIGIASSAANGILPDLVRRFCDRYPLVNLELHELTAIQQWEALRDADFSSRYNCKIDCGIEVFPADALQDANLEHRLLQTESLVAVLPEGHPLGRSGRIALQDLAAESLILPSLQAFPFYEAFLEKCTESGFQPKVLKQTTATWMLTLLSLVAAGVGIAILPSNVLNLQRRGVVFCQIEGLELERNLSIVWHCRNDSILLKNFLELL